LEDVDLAGQAIEESIIRLRKMSALGPR
jgi:hypothetical protein